MSDTTRTVGPVTTSATIGGALAIIVGFILQQAFNIELTTPVEGALTIVFGGIGTLIGGYLVRPSDGQHRA